jgi:hypothetical protein
MGTGNAEERSINEWNTFPSQELPCSGSTGIISAFPLKAEQHPEE